MTLRQILDVLWKRKWIIAAVTIAALLTAVFYLQVRTVTYVSSSLVRLNDVVSVGAVTGEVGGVAVDVGQEAATSPAVLAAAAAQLGEDPAALAGSVSADVDDSTALTRLYISAVGSSPDQAQARAAALTSAYTAHVDEQLATALATLQQRQTDAIAEARALQQEVADNPGDAIAATNLATALSQMTSINLSIESVNDAGAATAIVTDAQPGESTVPSALIVLLLALATGIIVSIAAALIRDQFDNRLRGEDEIEGIADARSLGELSWDRSVANTTPPLPVAHNERTDLSERLRTLRSTLQVFLPPRESVAVITSVEPGDGKSFVSANLAMAWARAGKTVILVGGDLRRPDLGRYFGEAADGEGLADILDEHEIGEALWREAVETRLNTTKYRRLRILPAGAEPPDPADLLARPVLGEVVAHLRTLADVVIIDSPPAIGMADAALLALQSDGAVVIASVRKTDRVMLAETVTALRAAGAEVIGVVANRSRRKLPKTYSAYYVNQRAAADTARASSTPDGAPEDTMDDLRKLLNTTPRPESRGRLRTGADDGESAPEPPDSSEADRKTASDAS
ncbi:polysaccharide biosynthesis tyrosine autokinase [Microbacterium sulfonylureivorans]|uniref:polysaccharide biosynthesis tyrosine autokinase n=1 Tax=Microbacterium sulfonylureivorans TaxID=2486854 RepID=UPI000FDCA9CD|nr:polysaccharide biosynthesis tyrosine autokinase [Microbacterium sulfonylureivorans]